MTLNAVERMIYALAQLHDLHRSNLAAKRNPPPPPQNMDESYHLYQMYQQQMQQGDHVKKSMMMSNHDESNRLKDLCMKQQSMASSDYSMGINDAQQSGVSYQPSSVRIVHPHLQNHSTRDFSSHRPWILIVHSNHRCLTVTTLLDCMHPK